MIMTENPILKAGFDKLIEILQSQHGHCNPEEGWGLLCLSLPDTDTTAWGYLVDPFSYSMYLVGAKIVVVADDTNNSEKTWSLAAANLAERIDAWVREVQDRDRC